MQKFEQHHPKKGYVKSEEIAPGIHRQIVPEDDALLKIMASYLKEVDGKLKLQAQPQLKEKTA